MNELKNTRWTKTRTPEDAEFETKPNILYITVESDRCYANAIFTSTNTYRKAADWLFRYLELAKVGGVVEQAKTEVMAKAVEANREDVEIIVEDSNEMWNCIIQKRQKGVFGTRMNWRFSEEPQAVTETPESEEIPADKPAKKKGSKPLNYEKFRALAKKCYMEGGDTVYECWSEAEFDEYVKECGPMTKAAALDLFHSCKASTDRERWPETPGKRLRKGPLK